MKPKDLAVNGIFLAILIICSWISFPIGVVPITLSLFAIFLIGGVLPPTNALVITSIYLLLGIIGLPIFSNFSAGISKIAGPTGGFLISYPIMATVIALIVSHKNKLSFFVAGMTISLIICYALGILFMIINLKINIKNALISGVLPFVLTDICKIALAATLSYRLSKIRKVAI